MKRAMLVMLLLLPFWGRASTPLEATLAEMATSADHILIGTVTGVDMVDGDGNAIVDPAARPRLLLLKGPDFLPILAGVFSRLLEDEASKHLSSLEQGQR